MDKSEARNLLIPALAELLADPKTNKREAAVEAVPGTTMHQWGRCREILETHQDLPRFAEARIVENALREML